MKFYKFRYDEDHYLLIKKYQSNRYNIEIEMVTVAKFDNEFNCTKSLYRNISLFSVCKIMRLYNNQCHYNQLCFDDEEVFNEYLESKRLLEYLETEYDEEKIKNYILQDKELKKKEREEKIRIVEKEKQKKKQEQEYKRLKRIEEEKERKQKWAIRQIELEKEQEIYTQEWKARLQVFLNNVIDGTYEPSDIKRYGYIGYGS